MLWITHIDHGGPGRNDKKDETQDPFCAPSAGEHIESFFSYLHVCLACWTVPFLRLLLN